MTFDLYPLLARGRGQKVKVNCASCRQIAAQSCLDQRDCLVHTIKRDEPAKARALACAHQHLIKCAEPIAQRLKPMIFANRKDKRLQRLIFNRPIIDLEPRNKILKGCALRIIGQTEGFFWLHKIIVIPHRKARRLMELAERFGLPVITIVDTAGAYPGRGAEERGQAEAIARSIETCLNLTSPIVSAVVGEGGSGGAIALATGNRVLMYEHAVYSVISPEGCASILWRSADHARDAAESLRLTAQDMMKLGVIDGIVEEPLGAAHRDPKQAIANLGEAIDRQLADLSGLSGDALVQDRHDKYIALGEKGLA